MDLGTVTYEDGQSRHFCVSCGIGYDAAVCEEALHSKMKNVLNKIGLGKLTYLSIALKQLFAAKAVSGKITLDNGYPITIDNMLFTACMLHRFEGGGFMFCPDADATDGILNLCVVGDLPKPIILMALPTAFSGSHYRFEGITPYQAKQVTIESSAPLWVHTDGEVTRNNRFLPPAEYPDSGSLMFSKDYLRNKKKHCNFFFSRYTELCSKCNNSVRKAGCNDFNKNNF